MNKKQAMYERIERHGANLNAIFKTEYDNVTLCKKLRRLESKAHQLATDYCNGVVDEQNVDCISNPILEKVCKILNVRQYHDKNTAIDDSWPIFLNYDARGYALKIRDSFIKERCLNIFQDWGGYGIIAPDLS